MCKKAPNHLSGLFFFEQIYLHLFFFNMHFLSPSSILFSWHLSYQFVGCLFVILYCSMLLLVYFSNESILKRKRTAHRGSAKKCSTQPATGIKKLWVVVCHHAIFVWLLFCSSKIALYTILKELFDVASYMTLLGRYRPFTTTF
jgi:Na+/melibiose symporter-like transporter